MSDVSDAKVSLEPALPVINRLTEELSRDDPGGLLGVYLFGSWVTGGLRPDSDIDLLTVTTRSLSLAERQRLVGFLLQFSGRRATVAPGRPLEVTSIVIDDVVPWVYPPACDFLYGEWLRDEFVDGRTPERRTNPDLAVVLAMLSAALGSPTWVTSHRPPGTSAHSRSAPINAGQPCPAPR